MYAAAPASVPPTLVHGSTAAHSATTVCSDVGTEPEPVPGMYNEVSVLNTISRLTLGADTCTGCLIDDDWHKVVFSSNLNSHHSMSANRCQAAFTMLYWVSGQKLCCSFQDVSFTFNLGTAYEVKRPGSIELYKADLRHLQQTGQLDFRFTIPARRHLIEDLDDVTATVTMELSKLQPSPGIEVHFGVHGFELNPLRRRASALMEHLYVLHHSTAQATAEANKQVIEDHRRRVLRQGMLWRIAEHVKSQLEQHDDSMLQHSNSLQDMFDAIFAEYQRQVVSKRIEGQFFMLFVICKLLCYKWQSLFTSQIYSDLNNVALQTSQKPYWLSSSRCNLKLNNQGGKCPSMRCQSWQNTVGFGDVLKIFTKLRPMWQGTETHLWEGF